MGLDADMRKVTERFNSWGAQAVIMDQDFAYIDGQIQRHYENRSRLFEDLQNALKRDMDIQSPWDNLCDKGIELLERLNSEIASKVPGGFSGINLNDFYEGEKRAWQACKSGRIGLMAEIIFDIMKNDIEIIKKLEEDLKKAREDAQVIDEAARATFGEMSGKIRDVAVEVAAGLAVTPIALVPMVGKVLAPKAKSALQGLMGGSAAVRDLSKRKVAARKILLSNREMIDQAKSKIDDKAIEEIRKKCEDNANSWKSAASSDFSVDWDCFGRASVEIIKTKERSAVERSNMIYQTVRPAYTEAITQSFIAMMSDPSTLKNLGDKIDDDLRKVFEDLGKEDAVIAALKDSDPKKQAHEQMKEIINDLQNGLKELKTALRDQEEMLRT